MQQVKTVFENAFTREEHGTWNILFDTMSELMEKHACKEFLQGLEMINLPGHRIPTLEELNEKLEKLGSWELVVAENEYLDEEEWGEHLRNDRWPMSDYIRPRNKLDRIDKPDVFHDFFGHLPQIVHPVLLEMTKRFGRLYKLASTERECLEVSRFWWHTLEFGIKWEDDEKKVFGSYSSKEMLLKAINPELHRPFDLDTVINTPGGDYGPEKKFFVLESWDQLRKATEEMKERLL